MQNSKLISILKSLNPTEFRQFYRYLQAPLLTQSKDVLKLYDIVRKHSPAFDSPKLDRQKVFKKLYPEKAFDGNRFSILLFKLTKILDEYLIFLKFQQDEFEKKKLLTQIYGERNLNVIFKKNTEELLEELEVQPYRDAGIFFEKYSLYKSIYHVLFGTKQSILRESLEKANENFYSFFELQRLEWELFLKNRGQIFDEPNMINFHKKSNQKIIKNPVHRIYTSAIQLLETKEEKQFLYCKNLLFQHSSYLRKEVIFNLSSFLINYCIWNYSKDEKKYPDYAFELYKFIIKRGILVQNDIIPGTMFLNIVILSSGLGEFTWAINFIKSYAQFLEYENADNFLNLANGFLNFHKKEYDSTLNNLTLVLFKDKKLQVAARTLEIRTHFEFFLLDNSYKRFMISTLNSFQKYLKRETSLTEIKKNNHFNLIEILHRFIKHNDFDIDKVVAKKEMLDFILKNKVSSKKWLLDKIRQW